jgi:hypothetical protein
MARPSNGGGTRFGWCVTGAISARPNLAGEPVNEQKRRPAAFVEIVQPRAVDIDELFARRHFLFDLARRPTGKQNEADQDQEDEPNREACEPNNHFLPPRASQFQ